MKCKILKSQKYDSGGYSHAKESRYSQNTNHWFRPIIIGQACEFDYSGTQACKALRKLGYEIVLVNSNPATIMTDPETADVTYIEPLNVERLEYIIAKEPPGCTSPEPRRTVGIKSLFGVKSGGSIG